MAGKTLIRKEATQYERDVLGRPVWWSDRISEGVHPRNGRRRADPIARFWSHVTKGLGCWEWQLTRDADGYGFFKLADGRQLRPHRVAWELTNGDIPKGLTIDHNCHNLDLSCSGGPTCRHRRCVRPDHLRLATPLENYQAGRWATKTACPLGHPYDYAKPGGGNGCRTCRKAASERHAQGRYTNHRVPS